MTSRKDRARLRVRGLYPIVDVAEGEAPQAALGRLRAVLVEGVLMVQLRAKMLTDKAFLELARASVQAAHAHGASLLVNDRTDIAKASGADGVHLGSDDLPLANARALLGEEAFLGRSTDTPAEAGEAAEAGADYVAWGAVWPTASKRDAAPQEGPRALGEVRKVIPGTPLVAIGGVTRERLGSLRAAGADAFAVIGALRDAPDPAAEARALIAAWNQGSR